MNDSDSNTAQSAVTSHVADFVNRTRYEDIPDTVLALAKKAVLDSLGVGVAGARSEGSRIICRQIEELACHGPAPVFGTTIRTAPRFAALANAAAIHADDYDDTFHASRVHPSGPVISALMADAAREDFCGRKLLAAFNVGVEVTTKVSQAINRDHYERGYHSTGTCGVFGATAAICNLRGMAKIDILSALGIAGSSAAGLRASFGTMMKPLHAGRAAENGWVSASLAAAGFTASIKVLEGECGFFLAGGGEYDASFIERLGSPWTFNSPGIAIKLFPSGAITHPAMSKVRDLAIEHDIRPDQVARVNLRTNRQLPLNLVYHQPATGLEGKFSMEFCVACILVLRRAGLAEFADEVVTRADVQDTIKKINFEAYTDEEARINKYTRITTFIEIVMHDGRRLSARVDEAKGTPAYPMNEQEVAEKFRECAQFAGWTSDHSNRIIEQVMKLEKLDSVRKFGDLMGVEKSA